MRDECSFQFHKKSPLLGEEAAAEGLGGCSVLPVVLLEILYWMYIGIA